MAQGGEPDGASGACVWARACACVCGRGRACIVVIVVVIVIVVIVVLGCMYLLNFVYVLSYLIMTSKNKRDDSY